MYDKSILFVFTCKTLFFKLRNSDGKDSEHIYHRFSSLQRQENNILLLLIWSFIYHDQTLEVLSDWVKFEESLNLYQRLIKNLSLQQTIEDFALALTALLCRERLLHCNRTDNKRINEADFLMDFDVIMNDQDINNKWTVFEQMTMSLMRVLFASQGSENIFQFLAEVLDKETPLLKSLNDVANQYCVKKMRERKHNEAFKEVREEFLTCVQTMLTSEKKTDVEWIMIEKLSQCLMNAL